MATTLTVFAYGNVDALHGIFNAVAMITNAKDFDGLLRVGMVIGFLVVGTMAMFPDHLRKGWSWFMCVAGFTLIATAPKADISIIDQLGQQPPVVVSNVPYMLALVASTKTAIGSTLTQMFETAFQTIPDPSGKIVLPSELSYIEHGVMFGSRLVRISREADFGSLYTQGDTYNYLRNCIFPSQGRDQLADQIENSTDLKTVYANPNPALGSSYHDPAQNYALVFADCDVVYNALSPLLNQEGVLAVARASKRTFPDLPPALAQSKFESSLMSIYTKGTIAGAATNAAEVMLQNIWINATADASALYGASLNDPSSIMFASMRSQAVQQMNAGNLVAGRIAEEALPMIRNAIDAILYAVFPVICVLAMLSEGRALAAMLKGYLLTLAWVELWPPLFAVTNYLQTLEAAKHLAAAGLTSTGQGLTLGTATGIYSSAVSDVAIAAYMVTAVPIIAAAVVWGMEKITSVVGAASGTRQAQQEAASGSKGNVSAGNVSFEQMKLAGEITDPHMATRTGIGGTESVNLLTGERITSQASSRFVVTAEDVSQVGQQLTQGAAAATDRSVSSQKSYETSLDAAYGQALSLARSGGAGATRSLSFDVNKTGSDALSDSDVKQEAKQLAKAFRIGDESSVEKALRAGVSSGALKAIGMMAEVGGGSVDREALSKSVSSSVSQLQTTSAARKRELVEQVRSGAAFEEARRSNREAASRLDSTSREAQSWRETSAQDLRQAENYREALDKHRAFTRTSRADWANHFDRFLQLNRISGTGGIANTARMQDLMRQFISSGELVKVDDELRWIPDQNAGPQIVQEKFDHINVRGMRALHEADSPAGGRQGVANQHRVNDTHVSRAQEDAGVSPTTTVTGQDLKGNVRAGQGSAAAANQASNAELREAQGAGQLEFDSRRDKISDKHAPIYPTNPVSGDSIRNKALDGVRGVDGSEPRLFKDEAAEVQEERNRRNADFQENAGKSRIPK